MAADGTALYVLTMVGAALAAHVTTVVCLAVAWLERDDALIEGAYFDRSVGADQATFVATGSDIRAWLAAAAAFTVLSAVLWLLSSRRRA